MNKKTKLLSLLSAPIIVAPIAVAVSCGQNNTSSTQQIKNNSALPEWVKSLPIDQQERIQNASLGANPLANDKRFDQTNDKTVRVGVTFSSGGAQYRALQNIINVYNKNNKDREGYLPVELVQLGSGYGQGSDKVNSYLKAKNAGSFFNLILNYSNVASSLAQYNMLLNFNSDKKEFNTDISQFSPLFTSANFNSQDINNAGSYILPVMTSTAVNYYDGVVVDYFLETLKQNNAINLDDADTKALVDQLSKFTNSADYNYVKTLWGAPVQNASTILNGYKFKASDLLTYTGLLDFSEKMQSLFSNTKTNGLHVLGFDDPVSNFESGVFELSNGNMKQSLEAPEVKNDQQSVSYSGLWTSGSPIQNNAQTVYSAFLRAANTGALVLQDPGAYTSTNLVYHKYAFAIGSTAGYSHNYINSGANLTDYTFPDYSSFNFSQTYDTKDRSFNVGTAYYTFTPTPSQDAKTDGTGILGEFGSFKNKIAGYQYATDDTLKNSLGGHDFIIKDAANESLFESAISGFDPTKDALVELQQNGDNPTQLQNIVTKLKAINVDGMKYAGEGITNSTSPSNVVFVVLKNVWTVDFSQKRPAITLGNLQTQFNALVTFLGGKGTQITTENSVQKDELGVLLAPTTWDGTQTKKVIYLQGPSLIGIHANTVGDNATRLFVNWLTTSTNKYNFTGKDSDSTLTPAIYLEQQMSYVTPLAGFEDKSSPNYIDANTLFNTGRSANPLLAKAAESFQNAALDQNAWALYSSPGAVLANAYRSAVASQFKISNTNISSGSQGQSFTDFVNGVKNNFSS